MKKLTMLFAAGVGYVLGTRAGRGRYEQIRSTFESVKANPKVQQAASTVTETVQAQAPVVAEKAKGVASAAADKARRTGGPDPDRVDELHPDSTARQEDPYPQGDLP